MKRVRDFHSQSWDNPFFGHPRNSRWAGLLGIVGVAAGSGLLVYVFVYSPLLRINKVDVTGAKTVDPIRITAIAIQALAGYDYFVIPKDHYFSAETAGIRNLILVQFPNLRDAHVEKKFGKLVIDVNERQPAYRLIIGDKSYLLDQDGAGLRAAAAGEGDNLIALSDPGAVYGDGSRLVPAEWMNAISQLHKYFATQVGVRDQLFNLDRSGDNIQAVTTEGWYAIIDPSADIKTQLGSLSSALLGKFKVDDRQKLSYIDVRFGDKIYYKWR